jgi:microcompartment protein CcmK/EutM
MQLARVIGDVVATRKDPGLTGMKLLVIQPLLPNRQPTGRPLVAVDSVGAGVGEDVFFVRGREASFPFLPAEVPTDAGIVGIVDQWTVEEQEVGGRREWESGGRTQKTAGTQDVGAGGNQNAGAGRGGARTECDGSRAVAAGLLAGGPGLKPGP